MLNEYRLKWWTKDCKINKDDCLSDECYLNVDIEVAFFTSLTSVNKVVFMIE